MTLSNDIIAGLEAVLKPSGLLARGVFSLEPDEAGEHFQTGVLVGHLGGAFWPVFENWHLQNAGVQNPLDSWSKIIINEAANKVGGQDVYPSDKPYLPFQRWAKRAEGLKASPIGLLIHPQAGLWHAYRGAILFEQSFNYEKSAPGKHPCDSCEAKPCLTACPINAVTLDRFEVGTCRNHLAQPQGKPCMTGGCIARNSCPVGEEFRYSVEQQAFHQQAFVSV